MDWDDAYANGKYIADAQAYPSRWAKAALEFRRNLTQVGRAGLDIAYGESQRENLDLFYPLGKAKGLVVFVHGGYWRAFDGKSWSHLAAGPLARGWAVAIPTYTLAPQARIAQITMQIARAIEGAAAKIGGPIVLTGHSAGGHLVARMMCRDAGLAPGVATRIVNVVPVSPLSDLRPLLKTEMNNDFKMDAAEATAESPRLCDKALSAKVTVWVGAEERPAFLDQARWLAEAWHGASLHIAPGRHHFDVIEELAEANSSLTRVIAGH